MDKMEVYMDNAATTKVAPEVIEEMSKYFSEIYGNASSLHNKGQSARDAVESARVIIAKKINADPDEIIFTSGGSESDNMAIKGYAHQNKDKGNHIITSKIEHPAVLETIRSLEKEGFSATYLNVDKDGFVDLKQLESKITDKTLIVSIMHANNEIGTIQNIESIAKICNDKGTIFHTDAVQSLTKTEIDVKKMNIGLASFSAHKVHGPKGVGALYIKRGLKLKKLFEGGHHEFNKRPGTENVPGIMGFAKAIELLSADDLSKMEALSERLSSGILSKTKDSWLNGSKEKRVPNNVNISFNYIEGESILLYLDNEGICVSTGSACSSDSLAPSHVLMAIGLKPEESHGSIRYTLSKYTTEEEVDYAIEKTKNVVEKLRGMSPLVK